MEKNKLKKMQNCAPMDMDDSQIINNRKKIQIAFYNHKGGVGKSTSLTHVAICMARGNLKKKVLIVDCDTQLNQSGFLLEHGRNLRSNINNYIRMGNISHPIIPTPTENNNSNNIPSITEFFSNEIEKRENRNLLTQCLRHNKRLPLEDNACFEIEKNLFLLAGHPHIIQELENDVSVGVAAPHIFTSSADNLPTFQYVVDYYVQLHGIDVVLVDLSPSSGSLNQYYLFSCSHFVVPCNGDFFSELAIKTLGAYLPQWVFRHREYTSTPPIFIGYLFNEFSKDKSGTGNPSSAYKTFQDRIEESILSSVMHTVDPKYPGEKFYIWNSLKVYPKNCMGEQYIEYANLVRLGQISNFNMLGSAAHNKPTAIFDMTHVDFNLATNNSSIGSTYQIQMVELWNSYCNIAGRILERC